MPTKIVSKLSSKTIVGSALDAPRAGEPKLPLYAVAGLATGYKTGESQYGTWISFNGNFMSQKLNPDGSPISGDDAVTLRSGKLFLPAVAENLLYPAVDAADKGVGVQFSFVIGIERDESTATNYTFYAEPLIEADVNDPLEQLAATAFGKLPEPKPAPKEIAKK